jgi:hypothetical protein
LCSRFVARAALFVPGGQSAFRLRDSPRGVRWLGVLRVRRLFLRAFLLIYFPSRIQLQGVWRTVRLGSAESPRGGCWSRTVRGASTDGPLLLVQYWRFASLFRTVCRYLADGPPWARGQSAGSLRTVRLVLRRVAKSFAS